MSKTDPPGGHPAPTSCAHDRRFVVALVLNYRDPARTVKCVASLAAAGVTKALIVDNSGAGPGHVTGDDFKQLGMEVLVRELGANRGFAAGVNEGVRAIREAWPVAWVLLLNNDAVIAPELPGQLADALAQDERIASAFANVVEGGRAIGWMWYHPWLCAITTKSLPGAIRYANGCCQLVAVERVGGDLLCEEFFMYGEDVALSWRLERLGLHQVLVQETAVQHEGSASSRKGSLAYETYIVEAHLRLAGLLSERRRFLRVCLLAARCFLLPARACLRSLASSSLDPLRAIGLGYARFRRLPEPFESRQD